MKVTFTHKHGREEVMQARYAKILKGLGRGTYMTRDMQAAQAPEIKISKAARDLAESEGVDLAMVSGSGTDGAITKPDVEAFIEAQAKAQE